jgi:hypothetical protein
VEGRLFGRRFGETLVVVVVEEGYAPYIRVGCLVGMHLGMEFGLEGSRNEGLSSGRFHTAICTLYMKFVLCGHPFCT